MIEALKTVIHLPLNVNEGEGVDLSKQYQVGFTYPIFVLADSNGDVINQWIGYNGGATALIRTLERAMQDRTTIKTRQARFETTPVYRDGMFLAGFYSKTGEYLKAVDYYRRSVPLGKPNFADYAYEIFENMANAVWQEKIAFDSVFPAAEAVMASTKVMPTKIIKTAQLMTRLCSKFDRSHDAARYLEAGMQTALKANNGKQDDMYRLLLADQTLYVKDDTIRAVAIKKDIMGPGWENERDKFYDYAQWCLERGINLDEAEMYARKAIDMVYPGKYRARVYGTVAEICYARGDIEGAIKAVNQAIDEEPDNLSYHNQLTRFQDAVKK